MTVKQYVSTNSPEVLQPDQGRTNRKAKKSTFYQFFCCTYNNVLAIKVEKDEIIIIATTACPQKKSKIIKSVGKSIKSVNLDLEELHHFNDLLKVSVMYENALKPGAHQCNYSHCCEKFRVMKLITLMGILEQPHF